MSKHALNGESRQVKWFAVTGLAVAIGAVHLQARVEAFGIQAEGQAAAAGETVRRHFNIPAQSLDSAIIELSRQGDVVITAPAHLLAGKQAASLQGEYLVHEALEALLAGSGLRFRRQGDSGFMIEDPASKASTQTSEAATLDTVSVTGTRIRRLDMESNNPLSVIGKRQIDSLSTNNVIDLLSRQPQLGVGNDLQTPSSIRMGFKGAGLSTANLRGLGDNRTLVLINGRRQVAGSSASSAVDLNTVSKTSLERVDIVTGGSSAVYGADAIAGVINLITRQGFDGIVGEAKAGVTEEGGGATRSVAMTIGRSFADYRGNVMLSVSHDREDPIYRSQREWRVKPGGIEGGFSYQPNPLRTATNISVPRFVPMYGIKGITYREYGHPVITNAIGSNPGYSLTFDDAGNLVPYDYGQRLVDGAGRPLMVAQNCPDCHVQEFSMLRQGVKRTGGELQATFTLLEDGAGLFRNVESFLEAKHYAVDSRYLQGETPSYGGSAPSGTRAGGHAIRVDNPFAPAELVALMQANGLTHVDVSRINNDFSHDLATLRAAHDSGRPLPHSGLMLNVDSEYRMQRYVAGLRGAFSNDWNFEVYGNYGRTRATFVNNDSIDPLFREQVDAVRDPVTGQIVCRSTLTHPDNGCTPVNIMLPGTITAADVAYSFRRPVQWEDISQTNFVATVDGTLLSWASPVSGVELPVGFAAGLEYRREASRAVPDALGESGELFYLGRKVPTVGHYSSMEAFAEVNLPLLRDVPFAKSLEVTGSYRFQDYTTTGADGSYGFSASWMPISDIKFRGAYARAVRAPNVNELYAGANISNQSVLDPCDVARVPTGPAPANRRANCQTLLGAGAGDFVQSNHGKWVVLQGNPNLNAEVADTLTVGVVLAPSWVPNLVFRADYYTNEIDDVITSLNAGQIVQNCVDSPNLDNDFCRSVTRDGSGNIDTVVAQVFNLARYRTSGWDFGISYLFDLPQNRGRLTLQANATYLKELVYDPVPTNPTLRSRQDRVGANPTWRSNFNLGYDLGSFSMDWNMRYIGGVIRSWDDVIGDYSMEQAHPMSDGFIQHDLRVGMRFKHYQLYMGVDNLLAEEPPMMPFTYASSTYPFIGRSYYAGVKVNF